VSMNLESTIFPDPFFLLGGICFDFSCPLGDGKATMSEIISGDGHTCLISLLDVFPCSMGSGGTDAAFSWIRTTREYPNRHLRTGRRCRAIPVPHCSRTAHAHSTICPFCQLLGVQVLRRA
jgi:hypothetical protein